VVEQAEAIKKVNESDFCDPGSRRLYLWVEATAHGGLERKRKQNYENNKNNIDSRLRNACGRSARCGNGMPQAT
jgi:hypothetical protein